MGTKKPTAWRQCVKFAGYVLAVLTVLSAFGTTPSFAVTSNISCFKDDVTGECVAVGDSATGTIKTSVIGASGGTSSTFGAAFPATGTAGGFSDGTNMQGGRVFDGDSGAGTEYIQGATVRCLASGGSTGCFPPTFTSSDAVANQTATAIHGLNYIYDSVLNDWDRATNHKRANTSGAGVLAVGLYIRGIGAGLESFPVLSASNTTDNNTGNGYVSVSLNAFNGLGYDRLETNSILGGLFVAATQRGTWTVQPGNTPNTVPWRVESVKVGTANNDGACPSGAANTTALASNASRRAAYLVASSANTDDIFIKLGATATNADFRLAPGQPFNIMQNSIYTGIIDFLPASGTQALCVAELN